MIKSLTHTVVLFLLFLGAPALGQGIGDITITDSGLEAKVELAAGVEADLTISFEQVVGLYQTGCEIGLSARSVDPTDSDLLDRLPDPQLVGIPAAFPVMIAIEPLPREPFTFTGVVSISLHTHNLVYTANSPLRLFASDGGPFYDITNTMGMGSYRVGGSKGKFSEFLIVTDLRAASTVIEDKFDRLQETLDVNSVEIDGAVLATLQSHLDSAWSWYSAGDLISAKEEINDFMSAVKANSGHAIPDAWRSSRDLVNVAGELREGAATLRFSLSLSASS